VRVASPARIAECAEAVDAGEIIVLPTRRWYMLCTDSTDERACAQLFVGKGRPSGKPLALVAGSNADVEARFRLSPAARRLAAAFWPGDLGLRLPWAVSEAGRWWLGMDGALVTRDPWLVGELAARTRNPPATTVVSRSTAADAADREPALTLAEVEQFVDRTSLPVRIVIDGGVCPIGRGLSVVDCMSEPRVVREGAVHAKALGAVLAADGGHAG